MSVETMTTNRERRTPAATAPDVRAQGGDRQSYSRGHDSDLAYGLFNRRKRFDREKGSPALRIAAPSILGLVVLLAWQLVVSTGSVPRSLLPAPMEVFARFGDEIAAGRLIGFTAVTVGEAAIGCLLAAVVALPIGYLIAHSTVVESAVSPYLAASQAIPAIAIAPLLVIWVGYGLFPITLLCALLVFFPVVLATVLGMRTLDRDLLEAAQLDGASGWSLLRYVQWPLALPAILTGLRNGFTLSITGAVVGEFVMGGAGLGMVLSVQSASVDTTGLFSTLVMLCLLAISIFTILILVERLADPLAPVRLHRHR